MTETSSPETKPGKTVDITRILKLLPHRYPFLLIDKLVNLQGEEGGTAIKNVTMNEPFFQGHFPGRPVMPGVLADRSHGPGCRCHCA
jgi:3-hydroxyacyl-[acyl-carrier-protein] dehydratase